MTTATSKTIASKTIASSVYHRLRDDIVRCALLPGEKIKIDSLCKRYEIGSTTPVREALNRLSAEGLVRQMDQRGFEVAPVSREVLSDLTKTRILLNEIALRNSMAQSNHDWEDALVLAHVRLSRVPERIGAGPDGLNPAWEELHRHFHATLIANSGSKLIEDFCATLFLQAARYRYFGAIPALPTRDTAGEHRAIVDAVLAHDTNLAVSLLKAHFTATADIVLPTSADHKPRVSPRRTEQAQGTKSASTARRA